MEWKDNENEERQGKASGERKGEAWKIKKNKTRKGKESKEKAKK